MEAVTKVSTRTGGVLNWKSADSDLFAVVVPSDREESAVVSQGDFAREIKMGRQPRSGDFPWPSAHSILNWIGGDKYMLALFWTKSSLMCKNLRICDLTPLFSMALLSVLDRP